MKNVLVISPSGEVNDHNCIRWYSRSSFANKPAEFTEILPIPCFDVFSGREFHIEDYWDQALFERFNNAMRLFPDENGVAHKMVDEVAATKLLRDQAA